jgi:TRAP transporter 4TM/12TM fusion protein
MTGTASVKGLLVSAVAVGMAAFHLYTGAFGMFDTPIQIGVHLSFAMALILLLNPTKPFWPGTSGWVLALGYDLIVAAASAAPLFYRFDHYTYLTSERFEYVTPVTPLQLALGLALVFAILDLCRRMTGWPLVVIVLAFLVYPFITNLPGPLAHDAYSLGMQIDAQYLTMDGIYGIPLMASAEYIALFIIFGAFLERSGLGRFMIEFAVGLVGRYRGGPAKGAVIGSALCGTISGSAPANVLTVGVLTIPMMKRLGYPAFMAGAIEAAASTGGVIMPPIMGSVAFLMAQFTGVSYAKIALCALIPALLYFFGIFLTVHWSAVRFGIGGIAREELPDWRVNVRERGHLVLPIILLLYLLGEGYSPQFAVTYSLIAVVGLSWLRPSTRMGWRDILAAMENGARGTLVVAIATAAAGMIVGVFELTAVGVQFAQAAGSFVPTLLLGLVLTMFVSILLGMGVPPSVSYIVQVAVTIPMLQSFLKTGGMNADTAVIVTHFFVMYYAALAVLTPPDALASIAAAGVAGSPFLKTALHGTRVAFVAFIVPFMFVYRPALLMLGTWSQILWDASFAVLGVAVMSVALEGYSLRKLTLGERALAFMSGIALIFPNRYFDIVGIGLLAVLLLLQWSPWSQTARATATTPVRNPSERWQ